MNTDRIEQYTRYITFSLQDILFGINILDISEIVPLTRITRVQQAPDVVRGLANLRGQVLTILDIGILMGLSNGPVGKDSHIVVFKHRSIGFIVDRIGDLITLEKGQTESVPANVGSDLKRYLDHVVHLNDQLVMIVQAKKILSINPQTIESIRKKA